MLEFVSSLCRFGIQSVDPDIAVNHVLYKRKVCHIRHSQSPKVLKKNTWRVEMGILFIIRKYILNDHCVSYHKIILRFSASSTMLAAQNVVCTHNIVGHIDFWKQFPQLYTEN